jgi:formyltetrahydrofolate deformylase
MSINPSEFKAKFKPIAETFSMDYHVYDESIKPKVLILASKQSHCTADLLYRWRCGDLPCDIRAVISNHEELRSYVEWHDIPYHLVNVGVDNKDKAFKTIEQYIEQYQADVIVLARYMQILPSSITEKYFGKIINIHHSFLPAFMGANPYRKAFEKGVKLVGATCHYVTEELDEGPIIEQDVMRIDHSYSADEIMRLGKDVEKNVLARGLRYHLEHRVITHDGKCIVFD